MRRLVWVLAVITFFLLIGCAGSPVYLNPIPNKNQTVEQLNGVISIGASGDGYELAISKNEDPCPPNASMKFLLSLHNTGQHPIGLSTANIRAFFNKSELKVLLPGEALAEEKRLNTSPPGAYLGVDPFIAAMAMKAESDRANYLLSNINNYLLYATTAMPNSQAGGIVYIQNPGADGEVIIVITTNQQNHEFKFLAQSR